MSGIDAGHADHIAQNEPANDQRDANAQPAKQVAAMQAHGESSVFVLKITLQNRHFSLLQIM
jgi:hypothetical protein